MAFDSRPGPGHNTPPEPIARPRQTCRQAAVQGVAEAALSEALKNIKARRAKRQIPFDHKTRRGSHGDTDRPLHPMV